MKIRSKVKSGIIYVNHNGVRVRTKLRAGEMVPAANQT
jgi:hypothetical protein